MDSKTGRKPKVKIGKVVIGIDIGKYTHVAMAQNWDGSRLKPLVFTNTREGFNKLWFYISEAKNHFGIKEVCIAFEPTGHYWESLAEWANRFGIDFEMIQPAHTHKAKELEDNSPGKTDLKDAGVIADLCLQGKGLKLVRPEGVFAELRYLTNYRQELIKDVTRGLGRLHQVMDILFPELFGLFKNNIGKGLLNLLRQTATPEKILEQGEEKIRLLLSKSSQGRLGLTRARAVIESARQSVGVKRGIDVLEIKLRQILDQLDGSEKQLHEIDEMIKLALLKISYANILLSIPDLGKISIATIIGETGDLKRYHSAKQLIKLAGLNLYEISSGQHHGRRRIARRGRAILRQILYLACLRMIKAKKGFYVFYQRLVEKGKPKVSAIIAVACKLLRVIFAMVRDNRLFNEGQVGEQLVLEKAA
jgi:transposase